MAYEVRILEKYISVSLQGGGKPTWEIRNDSGGFFAVITIPMHEVPHKLAGAICSTEVEAYRDAARRALWYLQAPGFEDDFEVDPTAPNVVGKDITPPPKGWIGDQVDQDDSHLVAERKTALMRVQNRLQQTFAKQLPIGHSVWEWKYENDPHDSEWPPLCRATAHVAIIDKEFLGEWARGQRAAQLVAADKVAAFLDALQLME